MEQRQKPSVSVPATDKTMRLYVIQSAETGRLKKRIPRGFCRLNTTVERLIAQTGNNENKFSHAKIPKITKAATKTAVHAHCRGRPPICAKTKFRGISTKFMAIPVNAPNNMKCAANTAAEPAWIHRIFRLSFC